ncbi:ABC transporter permease [Epibacterium ulvae]|nr:ABC transporter permease [Epibacterium ulvae]
MYWGLLALLSHWRHAPVQLVAIVFGLALSTALWSAVQAINATARSSYATAESQLTLFGTDRITVADGDLSLADYVALRRQGWLVSPVWEGTVTLGGRAVTLMAIDVLSHPMVDTLLNSNDASASDTSSSAAPKLDQLPFFAHPQTLDEMEIPATRTTVVPNLPIGIVVTDFAVALDLSVDLKNLSYLVVLQENAKEIVALPPKFRWAQAAQISPGQLTDSFHLNLTAFGLLAFVVGLFIVQSTIKLAVEQRRGLMRTLRSLGLTLTALVSLCAAELLLLALFAGSLGLGLGFFVAGALLPGVNATLSGLYGAKVSGALSMELSWALLGLAMTVLGTAIAGGSSLFQVYRLPILQGPATSARGATSARMRKRGLIVGGLLLIVTPLLLLVPHLIAGFALMGSLMLGSVLLLPAVASWIIGFAEGAARPGLQQWLWSDMRVQLHTLGVPLMALALAIATNIGVETMTSSFRLTFIDWINQRFAADLYIRVDDPSQAPAILDYLSSQGHTARPLRTADLPSAAHPTRVWGVVDDPYYQTHWPMVAQAHETWPNLHAGDGVVINEQMARARDLWPGDTLSLQNIGAVPILGAYSDYGNPNHQIIMSNGLLERSSVDAQLTNIAVAVSDKVSLRNALRDQFNLDDSAILDQPQLRDQSLKIFDQTFVVTAALNVLTLAIAGFALLTSFAALWNQRLPQIAPIWAMGLPLHQIARLEVARSLGLAFLTALFAIPLGLALAWVLLSVTNVLAFGWKLPLYLFPVSWLRTVLLALLAALLACAPSAFRLLRIAPSELLKVFANER